MVPVGQYKGEHKYRAEFPDFYVVFREDNFFAAILALKRVYETRFDSLQALIQLEED